MNANKHIFKWSDVSVDTSGLGNLDWDWMFKDTEPTEENDHFRPKTLAEKARGYTLGLGISVFADDVDMEEYFTQMQIIDFDKECADDLREGRGYVVSPQQGIKKDLLDPDGLYSPIRFGASLRDTNPTVDRWKCSCTEPGKGLRGRLFENQICPTCGRPVREVPENFETFAWMVLRNKEDQYIHPLMFRKIASLIGMKKLKAIIQYKRTQDIDGNSLPYEFDPAHPYEGAGMIYFKEHFDEIITYFYGNKANKKDQYADIMQERNKVFTHCIPAYTIKLRPIDQDGRSLYHEDSNSMFNIMNTNVTYLNNRVIGLETNIEVVEAQLLHIQNTYDKLYDYILNILKGKKGNLRQLFAGRYNFTGRCVIVPDNNLGIDEVKMPYKTLITYLEPNLVNMLHKFGMDFNAAAERIYKAKLKADPYIAELIRTLIKSHPSGRGLPVMINRNPSLKLGNLLQVFCIDINEDLDGDYTMSTSERILSLIDGDYDGDAINNMLIINKNFYNVAYNVFNPRNNMMISKNTGMINNATMPTKDGIVVPASFYRLGKPYETPEEKAAKLAFKQAHKRKACLNSYRRVIW